MKTAPKRMNLKDSPWLVVNSSSGSYTKERADAVAKALCAGHTGQVRTFDCQSDTLPDARTLDEAGVRQLAIFSGDGTISNYLCRLEEAGWEGAALPLPGGTKNLLCTAMFGDLSATQIALKFTRGEFHETRRACMRCGPFTALAEILLGPGARWADVREDVRAREMGDAFARSIDIAKHAAVGAFVRLVEPEVGSRNGYPGLHFALRNGTIEARGYRLETPGEWARQGWAMATSDFREGPFDDLGTMETAHCVSTGGDGTGEGIDLMVDGEREHCGDQVEIRLDTFGISFLELRE